MVYKVFDEETACSLIKSMPQNEQLDEKLHKTTIKKFKKEKYIQHSKTMFGVLI